MRGFLALEPDAATREALRERQHRLRDALSRQGVSFPERLHVPILAWPFATVEQLDAARGLVRPRASRLALGPVEGLPHASRPAEVGQPVFGAEAAQAELWTALKALLDPDPPPTPFVRLARVAPPSRKVGAALRESGLSGLGAGPFFAGALAFWRQTPQGFEISSTMPLDDGGP